MGFGFCLDFKFKSLIFLVGWDSDSSEINNSGRTRRFFCQVDEIKICEDLKFGTLLFLLEKDGIWILSRF
jgi:hypothetical protein